MNAVYSEGAGVCGTPDEVNHEVGEKACKMRTCPDRKRQTVAVEKI